VDWLQFIVQWLHVLLGIFWFGSALYVDIVLIPAISHLSLEKQHEIGAALGVRGTAVFRVVAPLIIVLGFLRGTVFGPIRSLDALTTAYGITWLVALVVTIALYRWAFTTYTGALRALTTVPLAPDGSATPEVQAAAERVKRLAAVELVFFFVIFTCMILMRLGL
jgi:uncharacterized membrane protein